MQVVVEDAGIRFGSRHVFTGLSASFQSNKVTALVGPSGSGKSTLLAAIAGFARLTSGHVWHIADGNRRRPSPTVVSWIAQDANILGARTALDNVLLGPLSEGISLATAVTLGVRALDNVGLADRANSFCRTLSGGEKQRVAVARSLASSRPLILADEPSASLDEANTQNLANLFASVRGHATVIVATHDPVMIDASESVVNLRSGIQ